MDRIDAYLILNLLPDIGPVRVRKLVEHFGSPEAIFAAGRKDLIRVKGIGQEMVERFVDWENLIDLEEEKRRMADHGVSLLTLDSENYPAALREIHDPPFLLYMRGHVEPRDARAIGIVGSRRTTHYGISNGKKLSFQLAAAGFTIISGLARGIDTIAHEAALAANGRTIAVLGSGVGNIYPPENQQLADKIAENGAVLSEFPVLYVPDKKSFPLRNRIVAGMSQGLLVVEAPGRSGSLITANQALEQGRTVFAVPGPIDRPTSLGCNRLIQSGAKLVCDAKDVIEEFSYGLAPELDFGGGEDTPQEWQDLPEAEQIIMRVLGVDELPVDHLLEQSGLALPEVNGALLRLEMKGLIKQLPGKYFTKLI
ncbi:MAG: DNA-processing protein DprA [Verrucomicrobiales bacterium]|nr:DNA-processing protein DprA [Verrucomicrobiales bacterium]